MERVTHHDRDTAYRVSDRGGDGPTVCFYPRERGSKDVWKAQARVSDRFPVVALDLSGHGDSGDIDASAVPRRSTRTRTTWSPSRRRRERPSSVATR